MTTLVDVPGALVDTVGPTAGGLVHLRLLAVDPDARGAGVGRAAMTALCDRADEHGWTVRLAATMDLGADLRRLVSWYRQHGFTVDSSQPALVPHHVPMVRRPHIHQA